MKKDVYILLKPENMDTEDSQNYHVIKAQQDSDTKVLTYPFGMTVICGSWEKKSGITITDEQIIPRNDDSLRLLLAREQSAGKKICANCVKHFYADDV